MDQVTQQNAAMVEQTTAATHALKGQSDELGRLIGAFTLTRSRGSTRVTAAPPAVSRPGTSVRPPVRRLASSGSAVPVSEGWQDF
jgi:methyl-accepting chemotaxis protein